MDREEPGGLQSVGSQRVRHDWLTNIYPHILAPQLKCKLLKRKKLFYFIDAPIHVLKPVHSGRG